MTTDSKADYWVYSTLASDQRYTLYKPLQKGQALPEEIGSVFVKGGAGIVNKTTLLTPLGNRTGVTSEELDMLRQDESFKTHEAKGFIKVLDGKRNTEAVAADMNRADPGAQLVPEDFAEGKTPRTGNGRTAKPKAPKETE